MLDKDKVKKTGYKVKDSQTLSAEQAAERLEQIKSLLPPLVNGDGLLDAKALQDFLGIENFASASQGYGLNFAGKGLARIKADEPTKRELKIEKSQSKNWDSTKNAIIRGDNLDALKILHQNYTGKIKMIYIDPPYNTGGDDILYSNNFKENESDLIEKYDMDEDSVNFFEDLFKTKTHSGWLYFMYPRLKLARDLLTDDGFIFITIDHFELNNLISISDEIFGEGNRLGIVTIRHNPKGRNLAKFFSENSEFMIVYSKNKSASAFEKVSLTQENTETFNLEDEHGKYRLDPFMRVRHDATREKKSEFFYPLYVSPDLSKICTENVKGYHKVLPIDNKGKEYSWKTKIETFAERNLLGGYEAKEEDGKIVICNKYREQEVIKNVWVEKKYQSEFYGTNIVKSLLGANVFSYPKSLYAVQDTLKLATRKNDIILDFFAGSGTTAHAVMDLNAKDGGNRKFILVQCDEKIDEGKPAYDFCTENKLTPVISSICIERVNRAGKKIKAEGSDIDIGYKVFSLTDRPHLEQNDDNQLKLVNERADSENTLYNMMGASGECLLSDTIEEIEKNVLYKVGNSYFLLGKCKTDLNQFSNHRIYVDGYATDISLDKWLNLIGLDKENVTILY